LNVLPTANFSCGGSKRSDIMLAKINGVWIEIHIPEIKLVPAKPKSLPKNRVKIIVGEDMKSVLVQPASVFFDFLEQFLKDNPVEPGERIKVTLKDIESWAAKRS